MSRLQTLRRNRLFDLVFTVATALGLALCVQAYAVKPFKIPSPSMEPTLRVGERVLVNRFSHRLGGTPKVGDIIVFKPPADADEQFCAARGEGAGTQTPCGRTVAQRTTPPFIKRVVAVAGDTIAIRNGHAIRNGKRADEPFAAPCGAGSGCNFPHAVRVPAGMVYVLGDNRGNSDDSRYWGPVPVSAVIGTAFASYWPLSRVGSL
jgi:signal peptidase I